MVENRRGIDAFFALLRRGLYGDDGEPQTSGDAEGAVLAGDVDWEWVMRMARRQTVTGIVIEGIGTISEKAQTMPGGMSAGMRKHALRLIHSNVGLDRAVGRLVAFFEEHGIHGVLLKGQGVARAYRVPQMRTTGDIDFYVGRQQYRRAVELCCRYLGADIADSHENTQHYAFTFDGVVVELHRTIIEVFSPLHAREFKGWMVQQLEGDAQRRTLTIGGVAVTVPSLDFDAIYVFYHALHHLITGGIGLRQLCDWVMLLHTYGDQIDHPRLAANIRRFGLERPWKYFAAIAVHRLGLNPHKIPLYDPSFQKKSEKILEIIIKGGNFGAYFKVGLNGAALDNGVRYALSKFRYVSRNLFITLPVMPAEAASFYVWRMFRAAKEKVEPLFRSIRAHRQPPGRE